MRVYKFLEKKWALVALRDRRLKIGRWAGLNDPFDLLPFASADADRDHRLSLAITLDEMNARAGWVCFSRMWSNPVIWAHYAEQHHGLCLGFDVPDDVCKPVRYVEEREPFPDLDALSEEEKLEATNRMLFTKYRQWEYEDEIRVSVRLDPATETEAGLYFMDFGDSMQLTQVIVGMRSATCRKEIETVLGGTEGVEIIRAEAAHDRFAVVPSRDAVRNHDDLTYYLVRGRVLHPVEFIRDPEPLQTQASARGRQPQLGEVLHVEVPATSDPLNLGPFLTKNDRGRGPMILKRIGIIMFVIGALGTIVALVGPRILESRGYYELVDNDLWFPIRMVFTLSVVLVVGGAGIFVLLRVIGERDGRR